MLFPRYMEIACILLGILLLYITFVPLNIDENDLTEVSGIAAGTDVDYYGGKSGRGWSTTVNFIRFNVGSVEYEYTDMGPHFDEVVNAVQKGRAVKVLAWRGRSWIKWNRGIPVVAIWVNAQPVVTFDDYRAHVAFWNVVLIIVGAMLILGPACWWYFGDSAQVVSTDLRRKQTKISTIIFVATIIGLMVIADHILY